MVPFEAGTYLILNRKTQARKTIGYRRGWKGEVKLDWDYKAPIAVRIGSWAKQNRAVLEDKSSRIRKAVGLWAWIKTQRRALRN